MKFSNVTKLIVLGIIVSVSAIGCKTKAPGVTQLPKSGIGSSGSVADTIPSGTPLKTDDSLTTKDGPIPLSDQPGHNGWKADEGPFKNFTVHFQYDSSVIPTSEKAHVESVANQLKTAPTSVALRVEGHCDERGTEEYNRSLGERRALALREELVRLGVAPDRIETISYGLDKPAVVGHDESAW